MLINKIYTFTKENIKESNVKSIKIKEFIVYSMEFSCNCCNYNTTVKANHQKHLLTKKTQS